MATALPALVELSQSVVSALLDAFRTGDGVDLIRESVRLVMQELIETEATEQIGAARYARTILNPNLDYQPTGAPKGPTTHETPISWPGWRIGMGRDAKVRISAVMGQPVRMGDHAVPRAISLTMTREQRQP